MISPITPLSPATFPRLSHLLPTDHIQLRHIPAATRCRLMVAAHDANVGILHVLDALSKPSNRPIERGDAGVVIAAKLEVPMTQHWTDCQPPLAIFSGKHLPNVSDSPVGTPQGTSSLIACVRERYYRGLSAKPSASWQRRVGSVNGRAPSTTRAHPTPCFPMLTTCCTRLPNGILRRRSNAPSPPNF
jgi:hypothetical protein